MAKINDKKAHDMVPQSWIINYLKMYKISDKKERKEKKMCISDEVINYIEKTMKT